MRAFILAAAAVTMALSMPTAYAESSKNCTAMWTKLDTTNAGELTGDVAKPYHDAMTKAGGTIGTSLAMKDFMTSCEADTFKGMQ